MRQKINQPPMNRPASVHVFLCFCECLAALLPGLPVCPGVCECCLGVSVRVCVGGRIHWGGDELDLAGGPRPASGVTGTRQGLKAPWVRVERKRMEWPLDSRASPLHAALCLPLHKIKQTLGRDRKRGGA